MSKLPAIERYMTITEAAARTGLPRSRLQAYCGSGLVEGVIVVGKDKAPRVKLFISETALRKLLWCWEGTLAESSFKAFRNKCARDMGINVPEEDNVFPLMPELTKAAKAAAKKAKRAAANGTTA